MAEKPSKPSQRLVFVTMVNVGRAVVLAQTAECLLNSMMCLFPNRSRMKNLTVEQIEKQSERRRRRTFGQLVARINEILKSDETHLFADFLEDRNTLIHRMTNRYGGKLDTNEGLQKANELALKVIESASINLVTFFRGKRILAERLRTIAARHGEDLDISGLLDDSDKLVRATVHQVIDPNLEKLFNTPGFNWQDPKNDTGFHRI